MEKTPLRDLRPRKKANGRKKVRMKFNVPVEKVQSKTKNQNIIDEFRDKRDQRKRKIRDDFREQRTAEKYVQDMVGGHTEERKKHFLEYYENKIQKMFPHILLDANIGLGADWHKYYNHLKIVERLSTTFLSLFPVGRAKRFVINLDLKENKTHLVGVFYARRLKGVNEKWVKRVLAPAFSNIRKNLARFGLALQYTLEWDLYGNLEEFRFTFSLPKEMKLKRYRNNQVMINR